MNNFASSALGSLPPLAPPVGFSNPGGTGNLGATAAGVSVDEFEQVLARCATLEAEVRELKDSRDDSAIEVNGRKFSSMQEFVTFYEQHILRVGFPGAPADEDELQMCFIDGCGLLALVHHDRDDATDKSAAEFMNSAKKAGFKGVHSLVIANSFGRKLPAAFGKCATGISETPFPV